ncbi:MAG: GNAT family N-acetyltransferase [Coriobacteriales bacterium]|jgi:GNAT superfamily N-acetyltransferase|nr:GNAT family N-acetyltransferase [Coriobacteriales bacterium]
MTEYRFAIASDIDTLVNLRLDCERADHDGLPVNEEFSLAKRYRDYLNRHLGDRFYVYVACQDGQVIATASLLLTDRPMGHRWLSNRHALLLHVYTVPAFRRQGHAQRLCELAVELAITEGAAVVDLEATGQGRIIYSKIGFAIKDDGCIRMELPLLPVNN